MTTRAVPQVTPVKIAATNEVMLQRKCNCGKKTESSGECDECKRKREQTLGLQKKVLVGTVDDRFEREADHIADEVLNRSAMNSESSAGSHIRHDANPSPKENAPRPRLGPDAQAVISSAGPSGELPSDIRSDFEHRFGRDFSGVRIHSNSDAGRSAASFHARAYTLGPHVVFGDGFYSPRTSAGRQLLAHELTHVVQQSPENVGAPLAVSPASPQIARAPLSVQRDFLPDAAASLHGEGKFCVDFSSGEYYLEGIFAAQAGVNLAGDFHGTDYTKTGRLGEGQTEKLKLLPKGECEPECQVSEESHSLPSLSIPLLPCSLNVSGSECGADIGVQCQVDLLPLFPALNTPVKAVTKILGANAEVGALVSLNLHVCKDASSEWRLSQSLGCFGFYADIGKAASLRKSASDPQHVVEGNSGGAPHPQTEHSPSQNSITPTHAEPSSPTHSPKSTPEAPVIPSPAGPVAPASSPHTEATNGAHSLPSSSTHPSDVTHASVPKLEQPPRGGEAVDATAPVGSRRDQRKNLESIAPPGKAPIPIQKTRHTDQAIGERQYAGHAVDQMQNRGLVPSVVENTIEHGHKTPDRNGRTRHYDPENNVSVVTHGDKVITVIPGKLREKKSNKRSGAASVPSKPTLKGIEGGGQGTGRPTGELKLAALNDYPSGKVTPGTARPAGSPAQDRPVSTSKGTSEQLITLQSEKPVPPSTQPLAAPQPEPATSNVIDIKTRRALTQAEVDARPSNEFVEPHKTPEATKLHAKTRRDFRKKINDAIKEELAMDPTSRKGRAFSTKADAPKLPRDLHAGRTAGIKTGHPEEVGLELGKRNTGKRAHREKRGIALVNTYREVKIGSKKLPIEESLINEKIRDGEILPSDVGPRIPGFRPGDSLE